MKKALKKFAWNLLILYTILMGSSFSRGTYFLAPQLSKMGFFLLPIMHSFSLRLTDLTLRWRRAEALI